MTCPACTAPVALQDLFCELCGTALGGAGRRETDLGPAAAVTDRGLMRKVNEDAYAIHAGEDALIAVVCDGVSTTAASGWAAEEACRSAMDHLLKGLDSNDWLDLAGAAVLAGQESLRSQEGSTTIALGLIGPEDVVVANVGDSRVYWLGQDGDHRQISIDDSERPHEITAWLGRDGDPVRPHLERLGPVPPGLLVVCSDGLWNYADEPSSVAGLLPHPEHRRPARVARLLVDAALSAGGADNVTVAVLEISGGNDGRA